VLLATKLPTSFEGLVSVLIDELAARRGDGEVLLALDAAVSATVLLCPKAPIWDR
jgi:hypothetical protein